jgi:carboxylesterase
VGCLLLHGFTATPQEMRGLGERLHGGGYTVHGVCLAGHGTSAGDLARTSWCDWLASAREGLSQLRQHADTTVLVGLSLGSLLALALAHERPQEVSGLALLSTALVLTDRRPERYLALLRAGTTLLPERWQYIRKGGRDVADPVARTESPSYQKVPLRSIADLVELQRRTRAMLREIRQPVLAVHARHDHTCPLENVSLLRRELPKPPQVELLEQSFHVITVDCEKERVAEAVRGFVSTVAQGEAHRSGLRDRRSESVRQWRGTEVGLCARCRHVRWVTAVRSTFVLCLRSQREPSFPRYPQVPVRVCPGYDLDPDAEHSKE